MHANGFQIDAPARDFESMPLAAIRPSTRQGRKRRWRQQLRSVVGRMGPGWGLIVLAVLAADIVVAVLAWELVRLVTG